MARPATVLVVVLLAVLAGLLAVQSGLFAPPLKPSDYENTTVTLVDENGTDLATVDVRIADTNRKRHVGLGETDSLAPGEGMLFVHDDEDTYAYVMRDMAFPLDIVFLAPNGTITTIHHAETEPEVSGAELTRYRGRGKYVLEVPRGYTTETDVDVGDRVRIPDDVD
jgi:uncharacterized membrane protein (UPF0127 family)